MNFQTLTKGLLSGASVYKALFLKTYLKSYYNTAVFTHPWNNTTPLVCSVVCPSWLQGIRHVLHNTATGQNNDHSIGVHSTEKVLHKFWIYSPGIFILYTVFFKPQV